MVRAQTANKRQLLLCFALTAVAVEKWGAPRVGGSSAGTWGSMHMHHSAAVAAQEGYIGVNLWGVLYGCVLPVTATAVPSLFGI